MTTKFLRHQGFTLAEMAVVTLIMSIAMTMGVQAFNAMLTNSAYSVTKTKQDTIKQALISFLRSNKRLPCPDTAALPNGLEVAPCTTAVQGYGVVPWATLGLARDAALDGWSNFFTYRVSNDNAALAAPLAPPVPRAQSAKQNWTTTGATGFDISSLNSPTTGGNLSIQIDQRNSAGVISRIAYNAVVVIYSHGKNGFGANTIKGTPIAAPVSADEVVNNTPGTTRFITRDITDSAGAPGGAYDDIVAYMTPQDLLQPMLNEKTLTGICRSYCGISAAGCLASAVQIGNPAPTCP